MKIQRKHWFWIAAAVAVSGILWQVVMRSGPMAAVEVTVQALSEQEVRREAFGIGQVEARRSYRIGPTAPGRVQSIQVDVGDTVEAGALLGEMDPVDIEAKIRAQEAGITGAKADVAAAEFALRELAARKDHAANQAARYPSLSKSSTVSAETNETKRQELSIAEAAYHAGLSKLDAARQGIHRAEEELAVLVEQHSNLRLVAQVSGLVVARHAEPGTTVMAGQPVIEIIDPSSLWVNVRFDQMAAAGIRPALAARVVLRSRPGDVLPGKIARVEPLAAAVTEELLAKVTFDEIPEPLPPVGELCEVTVALGHGGRVAVVPAAAIHGGGNDPWVWVLEGRRPRPAKVLLGTRDLDGNVEITGGLSQKAEVVVFSQKPLDEGSRIRVVKSISGGRR
jgi:RND family efflux transporter MFP subunit